MLDQGENVQGPRWQATGKFSDLADLLAQTAGHPALVILGTPGSGKSTLLRHHELESAQAALAGDEPLHAIPVTFFIELNRHRSASANQPLPAPMDWLSLEWRRRAPTLPPLGELVTQRRVTFLLDALNEVPGDAASVVRLWREFLTDLVENFPGNRVVFSCRSLDYSASLSSKDLPVPQARLEELADGQMEEFLVKYAPDQGAALWQKLKATPQVEVFRTPYYLRLLVEQCRDGEIPVGRAALFTRFVRAVLGRELAGGNPRLGDARLFTERDRLQLEQGRWHSPFQLPERGRFVPSLARLAFRMQVAQPGRQAAQVRIAESEALEFLGGPEAADGLKAACDLGLLTPDVSRDEICFYHQLLQEYFAARHLAAHPQPELVRQEWEATRVQPTLAETLAGLPDSDSLPPLPASGWEETTVLAAGMATDPAGFVRELMAANLPLAGRAAAQAQTELIEPLKPELRQALLTRSRDQQTDLRARIAAGLALGELGDPRFERRRGPHGEYLLARFVTIPAGRYPIGSDDRDADADEQPAHRVHLETFAIAQFPVTNAEWAQFVAAGGYDDERWWETAQDKAWRRGEATAEGPRDEWRDFRPI